MNKFEKNLISNFIKHYGSIKINGKLLETLDEESRSLKNIQDDIMLDNSYSNIYLIGLALSLRINIRIFNGDVYIIVYIYR